MAAEQNSFHQLRGWYTIRSDLKAIWEMSVKFPWRWDSGTITTKLDVIWEMSVDSVV